MVCDRCKSKISDDSMYCNYCGKRQIAAPPTQRRFRRREKGTGSVYKLSGIRTKPWIAYQNGIVGTFETSAQAVVALDAYNASEKQRSGYNMTFAAVYQKWNETHFRDIGEKGQYSYESAYKTARSLHNIKMREIKTSHLQAVIDALVSDNKSRSLCEKQKQLFSQLCKYAMQEDLMDKNYAEFLKLPPPAQKKERVLTDVEIELIRSQIDDARLGGTAKIALALVYTGMRINELLHVKKVNMHLDAGYVIAGEKTEAGRDRCIPVHADVMPYFRTWEQGSVVWMIESENGNPRDVSTVRKSFNSLMQKLEIIEVTPHTCRHTAASLFARQEISPEIIKDVLGHADYATTSNVYTHLPPETLVKGINKLKISNKQTINEH